MPRTTTGICAVGAVLILATLSHAEVTRGPYLSALSSQGVSIHWLADQETGNWEVAYSVDGSGVWGSVPAPAATACVPPFCCGPGCTEPDRFQYKVELSGLTGNQRYQYEVRRDGTPIALPSGSGGIDIDLSFQTPPEAASEPTTTTLAVFGDSGAGTALQANIAQRVSSRSPAGILHTGDMFYGNAENGQLESHFFGPYRELMAKSCMFPCMGNEDFVHDFLIEGHFTLDGAGAGTQARHYAFDFGPARVVVLDTEQLYSGFIVPSLAGTPADSSQLEWLCAQLSAAQAIDTPWLIVVCHVPPFTIGAHAGDAKVHEIRALLSPYFTEYGVDLVLSGHDHNYQRSWPIRSENPFECTVPFVSPYPSSACWPGGVDCYSFDVVPREGYQHLDGTIYVVAGAGGQIGHPIPPGSIATWDTEFSAVQYAGVQSGSFVMLEMTPVALDLKAFDEDGNEIDSVRVGKLRGIRGDINADQVTDLADAIGMLGALFTPLTEPPCESFADASADGQFDIADPIGVLNWLFTPGSPALPAPFPSCGPFETAPGESCFRSTCP